MHPDRERGTERAFDAESLRGDLDARGYAVVPALLADADVQALRAGWDDEARYRTTIVMERHGYGRGVYRYFGYPLPPRVAALRRTLYAALVPVANAWADALGGDARYPADLDEFIARCRDAGQDRPTPLILRYRAGDHNALHRDVYGEIAFPLQVTVLLSAAGEEFCGGEFVLVEQRPRRQSLVHVVPLRRGDAVVFPNAVRPIVRDGRTSRTQFRHGVGEVRSGERFALGLILHDAR